MQISNEGIISRKIEDTFQKALLVEDYPKFAKNYISSHITDHLNGHPIIERKANIDGKLVSWKTELVEVKNDLNFKTITFKQIEGPLNGLIAKWELTPKSDQETTLKIIHEIEEKGHPQENSIKDFFNKSLYANAEHFIKDFKNWCETETLIPNTKLKNIFFLSEATINSTKHQNLKYSDVHQGSYMKNTFLYFNFKNYLKNKLISRLLNYLFFSSKEVIAFIDKYGKEFSVYGLLAKTSSYQKITQAMVNMVKEVRDKYATNPSIQTLEIHTGTGNNSAEYIIPELVQDKWFITDREINNLRLIKHSLQVNHLPSTSVDESLEKINNAKIIAGILDFARFPKKPNHTEFDEIIANMGAYFGNQEQTTEAFKKLHQLLKPNGILYFSGYIDPHFQNEAIFAFLKSNIKSLFFLNRKTLLALLFSLYIKLTTAQWGKNIEKGELYLLSNSRLEKLCISAGFKIIYQTNITKSLNFGTPGSQIMGYALQKV